MVKTRPLVKKILMQNLGQKMPKIYFIMVGLLASTAGTVPLDKDTVTPVP